IDPNIVRDHRGGPALVMAEILSAGGSHELSQVLLSKDVRVRGTGLLTRRRRASGTAGLIIAGDAAGYIEPFTGEGMTWALVQGEQAGVLAAEAVADDAAWSAMAEVWRQWRGQVLERRRVGCRAVRWLVRRRLPRVIALRALAGSAVVRTAVGAIVHNGSRAYPQPKLSYRAQGTSLAPVQDTVPHVNRGVTCG
ncbi:MAG: NAD(P)/FAD-dependent oxidoreductase, partial [Planctomycetota bacterium]